MELCPKCHRKLLSHISANCNWCGCKIDDPEYQQAADQSREAFFYRDRLEQAAEIAQIEMIQQYPIGAYSVWPGYNPGLFPWPTGNGPRRPAGAVAPPRTPNPSPIAPDADPQAAENNPSDPADHIEL